MGRRPLRPIGKLLAEDTKRHHLSLVLQRLFTDGPASRADLARDTGLSRVTISDLVGSLLQDGLVAELGRAGRDAGRQTADAGRPAARRRAHRGA